MYFVKKRLAISDIRVKTLEISQMNKLAIIFGLIILPLTGFCDTTDYWHIYYNDSVIAKFNSASQDLKIELKRSKIKNVDTLSIRYGDDTPCYDCKFVLFVRNEKKQKLRITKTNQFWGKLSFGLSDLIEFGDKNKSKRYDFYYWEQDGNGDKSPMSLVLQVVIK